LSVTEYALPAPAASLPLATCCPAPDNVIAPPQTPAVPPATPVHVTRTADLGTVAQFVKDAAPASTFKFQVLPAAPPDVVQLTVAAEFPATDPRSGSVAVKLIVAGLAESAFNVVAIGKMLFAAGTTLRAFGWAASDWIVAPSPTRTHVRWIKRFMSR
jgi:hypothetical protein